METQSILRQFHILQSELDSLTITQSDSALLYESMTLNAFDQWFLGTFIDDSLSYSTNDYPILFPEREFAIQLRKQFDSLSQKLLLYFNRPVSGKISDPLIPATVQRHLDRIDFILQQFQQTDQQWLIRKMDRLHRKTTLMKGLVFLFWSFTLIFVIAFALYYFNHIFHSFHDFKKAYAQIGEGNYTARLHQHSFPELNELADSFNAMAEQLQELEKLKSDFFNKLVHDFKSPLDNIKQSAELLMSEVAKQMPGKRREEFLDIIRRSAASLRQFVQDQLDESRLISGQIELQYKRIDFKALVTERLRLQKPIATQRHITFNLKYTPTPLQIDCDPSKMARVIDNLISNAIKFSPDYAPIDVELEEQEFLIECRIRDYGPGIPATQHHRIFQKYVRLSSPVKSTGTGLGLYTARFILQLHGGTIRVFSQPGKGSTFAFTLPKNIAPPCRSKTETR